MREGGERLGVFDCLAGLVCDGNTYSVYIPIIVARGYGWVDGESRSIESRNWHAGHELPLRDICLWRMGYGGGGVGEC